MEPVLTGRTVVHITQCYKFLPKKVHSVVPHHPGYLWWCITTATWAKRKKKFGNPRYARQFPKRSLISPTFRSWDVCYTKQPWVFPKDGWQDFEDTTLMIKPLNQETLPFYLNRCYHVYLPLSTGKIPHAMGKNLNHHREMKKKLSYSKNSSSKENPVPLWKHLWHLQKHRWQLCKKSDHQIKTWKQINRFILSELDGATCS